MNYQVIESNCPKVLENTVVEPMADGWVPIGGVAVVVYKSGRNKDEFRSIIKEYHQAITRAKP